MFNGLLSLFQHQSYWVEDVADAKKALLLVTMRKSQPLVLVFAIHTSMRLRANRAFSGFVFKIATFVGGEGVAGEAVLHSMALTIGC